MENHKHFDTLYRLYKESDGLYSGIAARSGLTDTTFWILYAITHTEGDCTQKDLCRDWYYPAQTVNSAVAALQKKGLLTLQMIAGSKNSKRISLTAAGKDLAEHFINRIDEIEGKAFLRFSEEERMAYLTLFERHNAYLRQEIDAVFAAAEHKV